MGTPSGSGPCERPGGLTVRKAEFPGGNRMPRKRMPVPRKGAGKPGRKPFLQRLPGITGRIPGLVPGRESGLTWAGWLLRRS